MSRTMNPERFTKPLFDILDETFDHHHGVFLDRGTSLFETLETVTAGEASRRVGTRGAPLSAHVAHVTLYLDVLERLMLKQEVGRVDWGEIWRTTGAVTPEEWNALRARLRETAERVTATLRGIENWDDEDMTGAAMAIMVHTACHLGSIRQALHVLR